MFGVVHVLSVDGYSRKIVGFITIPRKNPITIYNTLFYPILQRHGLWDQIRLDHGTEFTLVVSVQQLISHHRSRHNRHPVCCSTSRQNHRAERLWVEVNRRINYPVKEVLIMMEDDGQINMADDITKFCVSWVAIKVMAPATERFVNAWNAHRIPGSQGGIPNVLAQESSRVTPLGQGSIPSVDEAILAHENSGGHLTPESCYGLDPIEDYPGLQRLRERDFLHEFPHMNAVFENILHHDRSIFRQAILFFVDLTNTYVTLLL